MIPTFISRLCGGGPSKGAAFAVIALEVLWILRIFVAILWEAVAR
jgi:hypothetical protein